MSTTRICSVPDCGKPHTARNLCKTHYARFIRSNGGRVRETVPQIHQRTMQEFVDTALASNTDECITWPFGTWNNGYGYADRAGEKRIGAHRLICTLAHGEPPEPRMHAAHLCPGNRKCVNPKHVRWATPAQNSLDIMLHGMAADPDFIDKFVKSKSDSYWSRNGLTKPDGYYNYNKTAAQDLKTAWQITQLIRNYAPRT